LDGTGDCFEEETNSLYKCTAIPGEVIRCKSSIGEKYDCVFFQRSFFACTSNKSQSNPLKKENLSGTSGLEDDLKPLSKSTIMEEMNNGKTLKSIKLEIGQPVW
jgi:hypothetical protein